MAALYHLNILGECRSDWQSDLLLPLLFEKIRSFVDVWFSLKLSRRYSYHWERRAVDGTIYRHANAPHRRWRSVATFPQHFHNGSEFDVSENTISQDPQEALREFLTFVRGKMQ